MCFFSGFWTLFGPPKKSTFPTRNDGKIKKCTFLRFSGKHGFAHLAGLGQFWAGFAFIYSGKSRFIDLTDLAGLGQHLADLAGLGQFYNANVWRNTFFRPVLHSFTQGKAVL